MRMKLIAVAIAALGIPAVALAQDARVPKLQQDATSLAHMLREAGEPMDRCSLGATLNERQVIIRVHGSTALLAGDRVLSLDRHDLTGKSPSFNSELLRKIKPDAAIPVVVERKGKQMKLSVQCENSRPYMASVLAGLDAAAAKDFGKCVDEFGQQAGATAFGTSMKVRCAEVSQRFDQTELSEMAAITLEMAIDEARWDVEKRAVALQLLRQAQGSIIYSLGEPRYHALVDATRQWPGGERLYAQSEPDFVRFREVADAAVRERLHFPETAQITMPHGFILGVFRPFLDDNIEGYWTCGAVTAGTPAGQTVKSAFVVVLSAEATVNFVQLGPVNEGGAVETQCNRAVRMLPVAQTVRGSSASG